MNLPEEDIEFLRAEYSRRWKPVSEGDKEGLIIKNYRLPRGYTPEKSDLLLLIPSDYPTGMIDMFYFDPEVLREDGSSIAALAPESHFERTWQRWSRHYPWRPSVDSIATHMTYVKNQLISELPKV
ncbi:MAG: hypothetical protein OXC38_09310 [Gammaproteobacteria bacterium]|nr:hypothetical protein [Gammaproteobacteria bacterium]